MLERDLKRAVNDYLQYGTNQGKWYADQLFSGEAIEVRGKTRRKIRGCKAGTADFYVIQATLLWDGVHPTRVPACRTIFLELKGAKGRTSPAQNAFKILVEKQGAEYFVIRSIEDLEEVLR